MSKTIKRNAKAVSARLVEAQSGNAGVEIEFQLETESPEGNTIMRWVGWLGEKSIENTMKTLLGPLGSNGNNEAIDDLGRFTDPEFYGKDKTVTLMLGYDSFVNDKGQTITVEKVKFVNSAGSKFKKVTKGSAKSVFESTGFKAAFLREQKESGGGSEPKFNTNDEVPF